jgi:protein subunit release factor B
MTPFTAPDGYRLPDNDEGLLAECAVNTMRAGGPGGQHQNMTDSAVRLRHRPTGITVTCRSERSQYQNKQPCLRRLRARIEDLLREPPAPRRPTRPSRAAREARLEEKTKRAQVKRGRRPPSPDE